MYAITVPRPPDSPRHRDVDDRARHEQQQDESDAAPHGIIVSRSGLITLSLGWQRSIQSRRSAEGEGRGEGAIALPLLGNQLHNSLKHRIQRLQHVIIGHTQHAKSIAFQKCIALLVLCAAADMCLTIDLDDEFRLRTEEVDDERTDNLLPPGT